MFLNSLQIQIDQNRDEESETRRRQKLRIWNFKKEWISIVYIYKNNNLIIIVFYSCMFMFYFAL